MKQSFFNNTNFSDRRDSSTVMCCTSDTLFKIVVFVSVNVVAIRLVINGQPQSLSEFRTCHKEPGLFCLYIGTERCIFLNSTGVLRFIFSIIMCGFVKFVD